MTHFAHVKNDLVDNVIVAEHDFINTLNNPKEWIQTSYNTHGGINQRTGIPIRKNYAGIGYTFDKTRNAFYSQKKYNSWILNEETCIFEAPIKKPDDNNHYNWNEDNLKWELSDNV